MADLFSAVMSPLKSAGGMAKELIEIRDTSKFGNAVIELQAQIMAAQQAAFAAQTHQTAMAEEISDLKIRMAELETWETEKQRYQLTDFGCETFAYLLKPNVDSAEPPHRICAACYQKGHKSILQFCRKNNFQQKLTLVQPAIPNSNLGSVAIWICPVLKLVGRAAVGWETRLILVILASTARP